MERAPRRWQRQVVAAIRRRERGPPPDIRSPALTLSANDSPQVGPPPAKLPYWRGEFSAALTEVRGAYAENGVVGPPNPAERGNAVSNGAQGSIAARDRSAACRAERRHLCVARNVGKGRSPRNCRRGKRDAGRGSVRRKPRCSPGRPCRRVRAGTDCPASARCENEGDRRTSQGQAKGDRRQASCQCSTCKIRRRDRALPAQGVRRLAQGVEFDRLRDLRTPQAVQACACFHEATSMIRRSAQRFSEKIMLKQ